MPWQKLAHTFVLIKTRYYSLPRIRQASNPMKGSEKFIKVAFFKSYFLKGGV